MKNACPRSQQLFDRILQNVCSCKCASVSPFCLGCRKTPIPQLYPLTSFCSYSSLSSMIIGTLFLLNYIWIKWNFSPQISMWHHMLHIYDISSECVSWRTHRSSLLTMGEGYIEAMFIHRFVWRCKVKVQARQEWKS